MKIWFATYTDNLQQIKSNSSIEINSSLILGKFYFSDKSTFENLIVKNDTTIVCIDIDTPREVYGNHVIDILNNILISDYIKCNINYKFVEAISLFNTSLPSILSD